MMKSALLKELNRPNENKNNNQIWQDTLNADAAQRLTQSISDSGMHGQQFAQDIVPQQVQTMGDPSICVAVLDGPVDLSHPCFSGAKLTQLKTHVSCVADQGPATQHGTHVASIIFGQYGSPVRGISPGCRGLIVPVFTDGSNDSLSPCSQIDLAHAITQSVEHGAHIINISGGELASSGEPHPLLAKAIRLCTKNNVLIVAAVGNDGCQCLHVPAAIPSTLAVGAMDAKGLPLDFSNWGEAYQTNGILAPGEEILGAVPGGGVSIKSGTSFASPVVSGIVALLLSIQVQRGDKPDPHAVRAAILQSAHPCYPSEALDCRRYLTGRLNIAGAYNLVSKKQQAITDRSNALKEIQKNTCGGLAEDSSRPSAPGVQNAEFRATYPETAEVPPYQRYALEAAKALKNTVYTEQNPITGEKNKETTNQKKERSMNEKENTCGCQLNPEKEDKVIEPQEHTDESHEQTTTKIPTSAVQAAESMVRTREVAAPPHVSSVMEAPLTIKNKPPVVLSQVHPSQVGEASPLVYALGTISYDFGTETRRDFFKQRMESEPLYLFTWDDIPEKNKELIRFLTNIVGLRWIETAKIEKIDNVIKVSTEKNSLSLILNDEKTEVNLKIDENRTNKYEVTNEDGKLKISIEIPNYNDPLQLLAYLEVYPSYAASLIWTLDIEATSVYAIVPSGPFASTIYNRLREFYLDQIIEGAERASIPGVLSGETRRTLSGQVLPVVMPELRGMFNWSIPDLVDLAIAQLAEENVNVSKEAKDVIRTTLVEYLNRVYYESTNLGRASAERAMNFAATSIMQMLPDLMESVAVEEMKVKVEDLKDKVNEIAKRLALDRIETERSLICRPDSDCWDVKVSFFDPSHRMEVARKMLSFTIDVSDVVPVAVGKIRKWLAY
jgi:hypothetical protein